MSEISEEPWSNDPNAPQLPYWVYDVEKQYLAGSLLGGIFYGITIMFFFRCMNTLLHPVHPSGKGIRWGLVVYVILMFSFVTINIAMSLATKSLSYTDNRAFPGNDALPPGPYGYQSLIYSSAIHTIPTVAFILNSWLADGILLYRCCVIYAMNYWVVVFPCLMYLASLAMGVMFVYYQISEPAITQWSSVALNFNYPYFAISLALNILLTLMIVARLVLHSRDIQKAIGASSKATRVYKAIVTMVIESFAFYAASSVLFIVPWATDSSTSGIFFPILTNTQAIAPFLIVLRVADRKALTSESTAFDCQGSMRFKSEGESTSDEMSFPTTHSMNYTGANEGTHDLAIGTAIYDDGASS